MPIRVLPQVSIPFKRILSTTLPHTDQFLVGPTNRSATEIDNVLQTSHVAAALHRKPLIPPIHQAFWVRALFSLETPTGNGSGGNLEAEQNWVGAQAGDQLSGTTSLRILGHRLPRP